MQRILKPEHKEELRCLYYSVTIVGRDGLWNLMKSKHPHNYPSQAAVLKDFLKLQETWQHHVRPSGKLHATKQILVSKPEKFYQCDKHSVENISENGIKHLFGIVDVVTSKFYCVGVKNKSAEAARDALIEIFDANPEIKISVIGLDNGTKFRGSFETFLKESGIKKISGNAH